MFKPPRLQIVLHRIRKQFVKGVFLLVQQIAFNANEIIR